jgi:hypothetical protein
MTIRGVQLRAILIPVGIAVFSILSLSWYGFVYIPSQQRYLNERNIRLLRILGAQIASKVNNFDGAMDNAVQSFRAQSKPIDSSTRKEFGQYVSQFIPELSVLDQPDEDEVLRKSEQHADMFDDPPRVQIVLDEGTHYLYLFYKLRVDVAAPPAFVKFSAKADIEKLLSNDLSSRPEFDTLAIVDFDGRVVAQSKSGAKLSRFDRLTGTVTTSANAPAKEFGTLKATGNIADVTIGGAEYKMYVQPVQLSLLKEDGKTPEEWGLCGLVRVDDFRKNSSAIAPTYWVMLVAALAVLCLAIPLTKLHVLNPRERFHGTDGVMTAITTFLMTGLLTFGLVDAQYFWIFRNNLDDDLGKIADTIRNNLRSEVEAIQKELDDRVKSLPKGYEDKQSTGSPPQIHFQEGTADYQVVCKPSYACNDRVLDAPNITAGRQYGFFDLIVWTDRDGQQRIKWTAAKGITPFINTSSFQYHDDVERALAFPNEPQRGATVLKSPNTGKPLTVFWSTLPKGFAPNLGSVSIATRPLSVSNPVLPKDMEFAVLDATGMVLFHSDPARNLNENFFEECGNDSGLIARVVSRTSGTLTTNYLGASHRLFVTPLKLTESAGFKPPEWSLVVFQDLLVFETLNLETLVLGAVLFVLYAMLLAVGWGLLYFFRPDDVVKWFWPDSAKALRYDWSAWLNLALSVAVLAMLFRASPLRILLQTAFFCMVAAAATFVIVSLSDLPKSSREDWKKHFLFARISFLLVTAVVPAIACFQVSYQFESSLLNRRGDFYLRSAAVTRSNRIDQGIAPLRLCQESKDCPMRAEFRKRQLENNWDVDTIRPPAESAGVVLRPNWLNQFLTFLHITYNRVAGDLKQAAPGDPNRQDPDEPLQTDIRLSSAPAAPPIQTGFSLWLVAMAGAVVVTLLFRLVVLPFFVLDAYIPPGVTASHDGKLECNLLLVGPPGSEKTKALKNNARLIFDVRSPTWADDMNSLTLSDRGTIGIDHLEYRFGNSRFRSRLLSFLEELLYQRHYRVWISSTRNPVDQLVESGTTMELEQWQRLFQSFRLESVGIVVSPESNSVNEIKELVQRRTGGKPSELEDRILKECEHAPKLWSIARGVLEQCSDASPDPEQVLFEIGVAAAPLYHAIWTACSKDEKLVLRQLAEEGVVNPRNTRVTARLLRSGLVRRDPIFRLMNETFTTFILEDLQSDEILAWEHEGVRLPWSSIATTMITIVAALTGLVLLTWQQLVYDWVGYVPALAPAVPSVLKLFASIQQRGAKSEMSA